MKEVNTYVKTFSTIINNTQMILIKEITFLILVGSKSKVIVNIKPWC